MLSAIFRRKNEIVPSYSQPKAPISNRRPSSSVSSSSLRPQPGIMTGRLPNGPNAGPLVPASQQGQIQEILMSDGSDSDSSDSDSKREEEEEEEDSDEEDQAAQLQLLSSQFSSQNTQRQDLSPSRSRQPPIDHGSDASDCESGSEAGSNTIRVDAPKKPSPPLSSPSAKRRKIAAAKPSTPPFSTRIVPQRSAAAKALQGVTLLERQRQQYEAEAASQRAEKLKDMERPKTASPPKRIKTLSPPKREKRLTETQPKILERTFFNTQLREMNGENTILEQPVQKATVKATENTSLLRKRKRAPDPVSEEYVVESDAEEEPDDHQLQQPAPREVIPDSDEDESEDSDEDEAPQILTTPAPQQGEIPDSDEEESEDEDEPASKPRAQAGQVKPRPKAFDIPEDESVNEEEVSEDAEEPPPKSRAPAKLAKPRPKVFDMPEDESIHEAVEGAPSTLPSPPKRRRGRPPKTPSTTKSKTAAVLPSIETSLPTPTPTVSPHSGPSVAATSFSSNSVYRNPPAVPLDPSSALRNRYSLEERKALDAYRNNFCAINKITHHTFNRLVQCFKHDILTGDAKTLFWKGLKAVLPYRDSHSFHRFVRRTYHNSTTSTWTTEADDELVALKKEHGEKWKLIAENMDRTPDDVHSRWKNHVMHRETQRSRAWTPNEVDALCNAVISFLGSYRQYQGDLRTLLLQQERVDVVWGQVSQIMHGTRSGQQCSAKWVQIRERAMAIRDERDMERRLHERKKGTGIRHGIKKYAEEGTDANTSTSGDVEMGDPIDDSSDEEEQETAPSETKGKSEGKGKAKVLDPIQDSQATSDDESGSDSGSGSGSESSSGSDSDEESSDDEAPTSSPTQGQARPAATAPVLVRAPAEETTSSDGSSSEDDDDDDSDSDETSDDE